MPWSRQNQTSWLKILWQSNILTIILVILFFSSLFKLLREIAVYRQINQEIGTLRDQLNKLESERGDVEKLIAYLKSDSYIEKEARLNLNLAKPGEKQVNIMKSEADQNNSGISRNSSNPSRWFDYFFSKNAKN